jgi:hypothetical protein
MRTVARWSALALLTIGTLALPAQAAPGGDNKAGHRDLARFSQSVALHHWLGHPDEAPAVLGEKLSRLRQIRAAAAVGPIQATPAFNMDGLGLPQNEESVTSCRSNSSVVLGSTNDFRGLLDPEGNFTGWHLSLNGGATVANDGLLPSIDGIPSGGDPVSVADAQCVLYSGSLNFNPVDPFHNRNGVGVYRSTPEILAGCAGGSSAGCWPTRRLVATATPPHFLDKEWIHVGRSGAAGNVVWVVYTDFLSDANDPLGGTSSLKAVRCTADLASCTDPILVSGTDRDVQFGDVTIGPDGRVYVTWTEIRGPREANPQTFVHKLRIAPAGNTVFGPTRVVADEANAIPFGGHLHASDFRVATYPKNEVALIPPARSPRVIVTWDACTVRPLDFICEEAVIKVSYSDNDGVSWSSPAVVSRGGDNYFPTISADRASRSVVLAWFTNRYDPVFHNRQDVDLVTLDATTGAAGEPRRLTSPSNESEADPVLGGFFIGDYIEAFAHNHRVLVHYNANYRSVCPSPVTVESPISS